MLPQSPITPKPPRASWLLAALLAATTLAGCKKEQESTPAPASQPQPSTPTAEAPKPVNTDPAPAPVPPPPESLAPVIRELGTGETLPTQVVLEFPRPVMPADGTLKKGTVVTLTPEVPGTFSWRTASTLVFTPSGQGFAHDTRYTVTLKALETDAGMVKPPSEGAWSHRFTTPAFRFLRLVPGQVNLGGKVEVETVFSGPVDLDTVRTWATFRLGEESISKVNWRTVPGARNVLIAQLIHHGFQPSAKVRFSLQAGMPAPGKTKVTAPAGEDSFALHTGKRLDITGVTLAEGTTGFYLEVSCRDVSSDAAASPRQADEYDPYYYHYGNKGCSLDDAVAAEALQLKPAVKFSIAPSRRGFRIFGDFKRGAHSLRIKEGTPSVGGGLLLSSFTHAFSVPARQPQLSFASSGRYLPRSAWRNLPLQHLNLDSVDLVVRHVPPENLVFWMSNEGTEQADERTSNVLVRKPLPLRAPPDALSTTYVDMAGLVPASTRGMVEVSVQKGASRAASRILLTDLSLVAKRGAPAPGSKDKGEVWVWALGMESTEPLSGVEVSLVKRSGQAVARCTTRGDDGCRLQVPVPGVDESEPFALIARKGDELTYLKYSELKTEIANSDVQGEPYRAESKPYRASLWSDRGVYRPGDTAHLAAVVRGQDDVAPPAGLPVELTVVDPRERELKKSVLKTNEAGVVGLDVRFEAFQDTGSYRVTLKVADREVASYGFSVEEFVPERMKVEARAQQAGHVQGEEVPVAVEAAYLFGGSAEGSPVELACRLVPSEFKPKENAQYAYGVWRQGGAEPRPVTLGQVAGALDAKGRALLSCPAQASTGGLRGAARLTALASVFESGSGRATVGEATVPVHPEKFYLGLQASTRKVKAGEPFSVKGVVVDWDGKAVADAKLAPKSVEVEYVRLDEEYGYFYDETEGYERYQRHLRPLREGRTTVAVKDGRFSLDVTPGADAAGYLVRVKAGAAQTDLELEGEGRYYWWDEESSTRVDQTPRPHKPTSLEVALPGRGRVGQPVAVKLKAPYRGRLLFTAETDRVLAAEWVEVEPGEVVWTFTPERFAPNVYVSAFLVKDPHLESAEAFMPDRAFGVASMPLEPADYTQAVTMNVPKEVRSNDTLTVDLELGPVEGPTFATVAVVDEGILSLTRFQSPDPLKHLFTKRALGVDTYETLGWTLLVPPGGNSRSTGGDEGGASGRVQPVKPVALWSGLVPVPADGRLRVPFKLPQYRGAVRVMAVTAGAKRIGRASAQVLVRDPLVLQTTLPRFLTQNDEIQVPVFVTNLSGKAQDVKVTLASEALPVPGLELAPAAGSPLRLLGKSEGRGRLENGKSTTFVFQAKAVQSIGAARLTVTVEGGGYTSRESLDVPLSPAGPRERRVQRLELASGKTDLKPFLKGWVPTTERTTFWVTANPYGESFQHLSYLVRYPYGCIEQTTSSTRPLLFVSELLDSVDPTLTQGKDVGAMAQAGIDRILSMQTPSGGFGYWPGATQPVEWGTAYATHLLLDARKLKYGVPQDRLDDALTWMGNELTRYEGRTDRDSVDSQEAYMHYVLALGGKGRKARVQKLVDVLAARAKKAPLGDYELEEDYMLKAALWLAGDRRYEKELRNPDLSPLKDVRRNDWSFYSDRRRRGFMLSTFQDLFGNDVAGEPLANLVAEGLRGRASSWYTTQELVWGVTGLGKRLHGRVSSLSSAVLTVDGKAVAPKQDAKKEKAASDRTWALARASERGSVELEVKTPGEGKVYLFITSEGVHTDPQVKTGGKGLTLSRRWRKLDGTELSPGTSPVALADLVYVELELKNVTAERVQNIALVDRLPAGWEIENARLGRGGSADWAPADSLWAADYVNIRDDRMEVFGSLEAGESKKVVYAVRAVTAGSFTLPSAEAEAMYDPRIWARETAGTVQVSGPWKDHLL